MNDVFVAYSVGHAVGIVTVLLAGRSRVRLPDGVIGIFHLLRLHYSPGVDLASNSNAYQVYILG